MRLASTSDSCMAFGSCRQHKVASKGCMCPDQSSHGQIPMHMIQAVLLLAVLAVQIKRGPPAKLFARDWGCCRGIQEEIATSSLLHPNVLMDRKRLAADQSKKAMAGDARERSADHEYRS